MAVPDEMTGPDDMTGPDVVILAAGFGARLGRPIPKCLTELADGRTILAAQLDGIAAAFGPDPRVLVVVGFKFDLVMESFPDLLYVYNEAFDRSNTSKSLLKALRHTGDRGVLWLNGDLVFEPDVLRRVAVAIEQGDSFTCVNTAETGDEEIKYTVAADGSVDALSKSVTGAVGEAVGINYVAPADKPALVRRMAEVGDQDYFERAIEIAIAEDRTRIVPLDVSDLFAVEIDFTEDLRRANDWLS